MPVPKSLDEQVDRYPLAWPVGWQRTPAGQRTVARFSRKETTYGQNGNWTRSKSLTLGVALDRLEGELNRLRVQSVIISTNLPLGVRGAPRADARPDDNDPGVAVYFRHKNKPIVLACDKWTTVQDNVAAIAAHIDAIRRMDRYGVGKLEQALAGYTRLLTGKRAWFEVLGFAGPPSEWSRIEDAYKSLAKRLHPDAGGSVDAMAELNEAYQTAKLERGQ